MIIGLAVIAFGILTTLFGIWHVRNAERASDFEKKTSLTDWGARQHSPEREAAQGFFAILVGPVIVIIGIWIAAASTW